MPLTVETFGVNGKGAVVTTATRVLVLDEHRNPLLVAVEYEPGKYLCAHVDDDEFEEMVATLGVRASRVRTRIDVEDLR